jgi:hypothetical protein
MHRHEELETAGKEAYSILTQFYEYDGDIPLGAKVFD